MRVSGTRFFETLGHFKNYFGASLATKALGLISIPVMTRILSPEEYGVFNVFASYLTIFMVVLTFNVYTAVGRYYYEESNDFKVFFGTTVNTVALVLAISAVVFLLFREMLIPVLQLPGSVIGYIPILVFLNISGSFFEQIFQARRESWKIAKRSFIQSYGAFGVSVVIIMILPNEKFLGLIWGQVIVGVIFFVYFIVQLKPFYAPAMNLKALKYSLSYSVPLIPYALSSVILAQFDRIMINSYMGPSDAGLYSFASNIGMIVTLFANALYQAWLPDYFIYMKERRYEEHDRDINKMFRLILFAACGLIFFGKEMGMILSKNNFHSALSIVPIIALGYVFEAIATVYARNIGFANRTIYASLLVLGAGALNIYLNTVYIPIYGFAAGAYTTGICYAVMAVSAWLINRYILRIHGTKFGVLLKPILIMIPFVLAYGAVEFSSLNIIMIFFVKVALFAGFTGLLFGKDIRYYFNFRPLE